MQKWLNHPALDLNYIVKRLYGAATDSNLEKFKTKLGQAYEPEGGGFTPQELWLLSLIRQEVLRNLQPDQVLNQPPQPAQSPQGG